MKAVLAILLMWGLGAYAAPNSETLKSLLEAQPKCGRVVRFDLNNLYQGFGAYRLGVEEPRQPIPGHLQVIPLDGSASYDLATNDAAIDVVTDNNTAYVLTYSSIEEWDLTSRTRVATYQTYAFPGTMAYMQHAQGMARYQNKLIIAHGRLGVSIFDIKTKRLVNQFRLISSQLPLESMAMGVTVQGSNAYVVMDNFSLVDPSQGKPPFRGIVVINMQTENVTSQLDGMDPGADAIVSDAQKVIVSFMGLPIWKYNIATLKGNRIPEPELRMWQFPVKGHPTGRPSIDDKYYYSCFLKAPSYPGENGGWYKPVPLALDRAGLKLQ